MFHVWMRGYFEQQHETSWNYPVVLQLFDEINEQVLHVFFSSEITSPTKADGKYCSST